jgi:hypothetical protein
LWLFLFASKSFHNPLRLSVADKLRAIYNRTSV